MHTESALEKEGGMRGKSWKERERCYVLIFLERR